jgi:hypothetical protein
MSFFHKHSWKLTIYVYSREKRMVRECYHCPVVQSEVVDRRTGQRRWIDGDVWSRNDTVYIVCENEQQYHAVANQIGIFNHQRCARLISTDMLRGMRDPIIIFAGQWWENEIIQDPYFTAILNGL